MTPPVFGHGELRLVLLTLIAQQPRHGYELIHALNEHFEGDYSPSAGTIYPRLAKLEEEGLVTKTQDGRKSIYTITDAGRNEVDQRREEFERITTERTDSVRSMAQTARAGLEKARRGLLDEFDQIAARARKAAEDALLRERAAEADDAAQETDDVDVPEAADSGGDAPWNSGEQLGEPDASSAKPDRGQLIRRVDVALQQFRGDLRQDAREAANRDALDEDTVVEIEEKLRDLRGRLGALLSIHR